MVSAVAALGVWSVSTGTGAVAAQKPKSGGTLTVLQSSDANNFSALSGSGTGGPPATAPQQVVYGALYTIDPLTQKVVMRMAQSLTANAATTVWTLKLRPGLVFSDSTPLNAAAVVANWDRIKNPVNASFCLTIVTGLT
ncbi:MAG: ABC transporter substrate-binding protein, partial [Acidimicrobiia bacterium]